jgi:hypothetical protein
MRYVRDQTGRFPEHPHYEPKEFDTMFERIVVDFLKSRHGSVKFPFTTDDLTVLIEKETEDLDSYADLSGYGAAEFLPGRKPSVKIAKELAESDRRENRYRTTLSHEYGHVRLHGHLFGLGAGPDLFDAKAKPGVIACKRDTMLTASRTDWLEWQAGYACGAVSTYARTAVSDYREQAGLYGQVQAFSDHGQAMIELLVNGFQVSRDAARVRLSVLGLLGAAPAAKSLFG